MFRNYLVVSARYLLRQKTYSLINILGLATGMFCSILIFLFIKDELSYDRYHQRAEQIYRLSGPNMVGKPWPMGTLVANEFEQIKEMVRFNRLRPLLGHGERQTYESVYMASPNVFEVFSFELLRGNPAKALVEPFTMVISQSAAAKFFGDEDPLGKLVKWDNTYDYEITGIMKDTPRNSHFRPDYLVSVESMFAIPGWGDSERENWGGWNYQIYFLLPEKMNPEKLGRQIHQRLIEHYVDTGGESARKSFEEIGGAFYLQPLVDIHLHSHFPDEIEVNGNILYIYIFAAVAAFILLQACINFTNLSTARSIQRTKEVGVRKLIGAQRKQLVGHFLGETILLSFIALLIAVLFVEMALPSFNAFTGKEIALHYSSDISAGVWLVATMLVVGLLAGSYPAFVLSGFQPVEALKNKLKIGYKKAHFRRVLILFQFVVSIVLIIATMVVYQQLDYCQNSNLGFMKEHIITIPVQHPGVRERYPLIKRLFLEDPQVLSTTISTRVPSERLMDNTSFKTAEMAADEPFKRIDMLGVGQDFVETYGLELVAGRDFSPEYALDAKEAVLINEAALNRLGWERSEEVVGKRLTLGGGQREGRVIGVLKDFHFESLHEEISPLLLLMDPGWYNDISVRINLDDIAGTLSRLDEKWSQIVPELPMHYSFLDQELGQLYRAEMKLRDIFSLFFVLAIFIACLGLFGLISFTAEQRTKEIGVRKVLGATVGNIVVLLSTEFIKLVVAANLIAWPIAYFGANWWLQNFAYRIDLGLGVFVIAGTATLVIAWLTMSSQAIKAALFNPVDALRYE